MGATVWIDFGGGEMASWHLDDDDQARRAAAVLCTHFGAAWVTTGDITEPAVQTMFGEEGPQPPKGGGKLRLVR